MWLNKSLDTTDEYRPGRLLTFAPHKMTSCYLSLSPSGVQERRTSLSHHDGEAVSSV